ncbi:MAG: hypothetical protein CL969_01935 [Euryarchaeota archaeon]|jgi:hypothetical protein|nr:hypothetical protein [Euryarchaeota archaeon]MDP6379155.1 DUF357 domain-containing protein [Candidatus Thalassarchaeaceae archaeon]MDP6742077.1 DUF357 domain-containing protein [Candidatus Thalassarchaeaceae archaeon]MDP7042814.1 DUF357 domain-containing protein [Candidatus Thalassarchaeaceae archaeon]|tara:strand:- start:1572 stop:1865 length:294 start_codon:yes stop_codon:yes gene_type:complete
MNTEVTVDLVEKYLSLTKQAKEKATPLHNEGTLEATRLADMMRMCDDYTADAGHFMEQGDLVRAFGAINYAHAWLDAAVRIGLLDGHDDDQLFTLPP